MTIHKFEDLEIWKNARELCIKNQRNSKHNCTPKRILN
jgi:hypothetical protein